jgi:hypothetical protein
LPFVCSFLWVKHHIHIWCLCLKFCRPFNQLYNIKITKPT